MNFREENWSKIKTLFLNSQRELRNNRMKSIVLMIREILKMLNQYAVDYPTFPVNQRCFHLIVILAGCWAAKTSRQTFGIRMVYREIICKSTGVFFITFSWSIQSVDFQRNGTHITACNEWTPNTRHSFGSEMPVRTVSQKFIRP